MNWLYLILSGFILCIILEYIIPYIIKKILIIVLKQKCRGSVVLTYDDGPGPSLESALLKILDKYNVKATFFLHGMHAELFPAQCEFLLNNGHEIGCHCYAHLNAYKTSPWTFFLDIKKAYNLLDKWISRDKLFRPPHGKMTLSLYLFLTWRKNKIIFWTIDSGDTYIKLPEPDTIINKIINDNGGVVLLHSFDRVSYDKEYRIEYVLNLTEKILEIAMKYNLKVCTIKELIDC